MCAKHCNYATIVIALTQFFCNKICNMLKHRGKILEEVVRKWCETNGWTIIALSKKMGQNPSTTYRQFEKDDLPFHIIRKFGKSMNHDFRVEFPEMDDDEVYSIKEKSSDQDRGGFQPITLTQALAQRDSWKEKYYELLEKHNKLLLEKLEETAGK